MSVAFGTAPRMSSPVWLRIENTARRLEQEKWRRRRNDARRGAVRKPSRAILQLLRERRRFHRLIGIFRTSRDVEPRRAAIINEGHSCWMRRDLIQIVVDQFHVSRVDLFSKRRGRYVAYVRHVGMFLCRRFTTSSYPEIARSFGGRDHTTALHGERRIKELVAEQAIECGDDPLAWARELYRFAPQTVNR